MAVDLAADWAARKAVVYEDLKALLAIGLPVQTAKRLAGWNPTLAYDTFADMQSGTGSPENGLREFVTLMVSRSESRTNPDQLEGAQLDSGVLYAIFIPHVDDLGITQVHFLLDGVSVHTEFATPWDYAGTIAGGEANRVTFTPGAYVVSATVTDSFGTFPVEASFNVE